jgi:acyl-coenzyme A thioesterase 13
MVVSYLSGDSFSSTLTPAGSFDRQSLAEVGNELSIGYTVPIALCKASGDASKGTPQLTVSATLALLDDFSSYALMMQDRNHRPGVSVTLNTEIVRPCSAGDKIRLVSRCDKIGKSVAFCSMELLDASGNVLARGKHIKYVKMGFVWDLLTSAILFPLVLMILEYLNKNKKAKKHKTETGEDASSTVGNNIAGKIFTDLNLAHVADATALFSGRANEVEGKKEGGKRRKKTAVPVFDASEKCFTLKVSKGTKNVLGAMHGGAVAAAAEEASIQLMTLLGGTKKGFVDSIEVAYISPVKVS